MAFATQATRALAATAGTAAMYSVIGNVVYPAVNKLLGPPECKINQTATAVQGAAFGIPYGHAAAVSARRGFLPPSSFKFWAYGKAPLPAAMVCCLFAGEWTRIYRDYKDLQKMKQH